MNQTKNKTFTENIFGFLKQFFVLVTAIVTSVLWLQGYIKDSIQEGVDVAMKQYIVPMQNDINYMKPIVSSTEKTCLLLAYRVTELEAILPKEPKIESK